MASKTLVAAFVAACFMSSSNASPCKVSSRSRDVSTSTEALTSTLKASMTTQTAFSSTVLSSTEDETITVTQSESSTETSAASDDVTTTAILSTTEILSTTDPATTLSTTQVSSTVEVSGSTTTTTEATAATQYILNGEFDDEITAPWQLVNDGTLALDATIKHDGRSSGHLTSETNYIWQPFNSLQAGVTYSVSAWVRTGSGCDQASIWCGYNGGTAQQMDFSISSANTWQQISNFCNYNQAQVAAGGLSLYIGIDCMTTEDTWFDSVTVSA
ncbi:hypothetical protein BFJ70_g11607 [Fusarium oxysporum]|uniref:Uncharacterized protein n=2 Tax=Fusarium oxysporum TaxID=5507 RepID=A0A420SCQ6_FUSOX|nr:hypothetical protein FOMG_16302 [Fusarium oxysporum f. sp. melonis 26406]KAH7223098.1 hypothetical protein BKA60DRAFT_297395 [Fusarium oxysporum]KAJ4135386.1 hypothetical protein NW765_009357 [Fusarium oxysporum]KAJ4276338.1 hypothetical protein NW764_009803 [Fusarium oxysporum]RKK68797.1 hypothetical protein BFJ69_g13287 [Fusarium oxysporum]